MRREHQDENAAGLPVPTNQQVDQMPFKDASAFVSTDPTNFPSVDFRTAIENQITSKYVEIKAWLFLKG